VKWQRVAGSEGFPAKREFTSTCIEVIIILFRM
jgi:hypothetical protein